MNPALWIALVVPPASATVAPAPADAPMAVLPEGADGYGPAGEDGLYTADTLVALIDGGAEVYRAFGVRRVASRRYAKDGAPDILADLFVMDDAAGAYGVYHHDVREGAGAGLGRESEIVGSSLALWTDRFFVSIVALDETPAATESVRAIGRAMAARLPSAGEIPEVVRLLPPDGLLSGRIVYARDPTYLATRYDLGAGDALGLAPGGEAALGRYRDRSHAGSVLLVARYPTPERARSAVVAFRAGWIPGGAAGSAARRPDGRWVAVAGSDDLLVAVLDADTRPDLPRLLETIRALRRSVENHAHD